MESSTPPHIATSVGPLAMLSQVDCEHLHLRDGRGHCSHPRVRVGTGQDARLLCCCCTFYETPVEHVTDASCVTPNPQEGKWTWAVGMTTAPRRAPTLERSLASLSQAGWNQVRLFAEPGTALPASDRCSLTQRDVVLGAFPNFLLGLSELYLRSPHADAYLMLQDDIQLAIGTRSYLERVLWPGAIANCGVVSLYCPSCHAAQATQGFEIESEGWGTWGALAYVFSPVSVIAYLSDPQVLAHRRHGRAQGLANVDSVTGLWSQRTGWNYYVHTPSLVQHTGRTSTLYPSAGIGGRRRAANALSHIEPYPSE